MIQLTRLSIVTDSAAGATAYSCGLRTLNYQVAITPEGKACGTLFESAQKKGFKTGIVVTSEFTHATPASFASHAKSREMLQFIGEQMLQKRPDVLLGGGMAILKDKRNDERLYRLALERYQKILTHKTELHKDLDLPVFGIFADNHLNFTIDKSVTQPSLASMTATTLDLLTKNKDDRFFLFIEGSRIDHAAHANDIAAHFHDILAFDETIKVLEDYVAKNPDTLVVVVADHETGGLTIGRDGIYQFNTDVLNSITRSLDFIAQFILQHPEPSMDVVRDALSRFSDIPWQLKYELLFPEPLNFNTITKGFSKIFAEETLAGWTTGGHTGVDINLFAFGPRSDDFRGVFRNDVVGRKLEKMFDLDLDAVTKELSEFNPNPSNAILTQDTIESHQH